MTGAAARLERACAILDELVQIPLDQRTTDFLPEFWMVRGRATASADPEGALAAMWESYRPMLSGGMGSVKTVEDQVVCLRYTEGAPAAPERRLAVLSSSSVQQRYGLLLRLASRCPDHHIHPRISQTDH